MTAQLLNATNVLIAAAVLILSAIAMGLFSHRNHFPVAGKTVLLTGGSQGMGRAVAVLLASKGANVVVVARSKDNLLATVAAMQEAAGSPSTQRFHHLTADLTSAQACADILRDATAWNNGEAPDVVWCCAGVAVPTLFIDTEPETLHAQMDSNYFTAAFTAHAALRAWLRPWRDAGAPKEEAKASRARPDARHLIFTSSFLGLFAVAGYSPYTPPKHALRGLADSLAMEVQMYEGAFPSMPAVKLHTVYPATIFTDAHAAEQHLKSDLTKKLEEDDSGQTPAQVAAAALRGLERGEELISTALLTRAVAASTIVGTRGVPLLDRILSWFMAVLGIMAFVRADLDGKTRQWGKTHGASGRKAGNV